MMYVTLGYLLNFASETYSGGLRRAKMLEEAGIILQSVLPWLSPIVIVPKKTQHREQCQKHLSMDYSALNSLLPPIVKANSKALSLVPLPTN